MGKEAKEINSFGNGRKKKEVRIGNKLLAGIYKMEVVEKRLVYLFLQKVDTVNRINPEEKYILKPGEYAKAVGIREEYEREILEPALDRLWKAKVQIPHEDGSWDKLHWTSIISYDAISGEYSICWASCIIPYISDLKKCFTKINVENVLKLNTYTSIRLYELLIMSRFRGHSGMIALNVKEVQEMWEVTESSREFMVFKRNILVPAMKELVRKGVMKQLEICKMLRKERKIVEVCLFVEFMPNMV